MQGSALTIENVIDACGGPAALASLCGVTLDAIRKWKRPAGRVPARHWPLIVRLTGGRISYDDLDRLRAPPHNVALRSVNQ